MFPPLELRVILEIGCGDRPFPTVGSRIITENEHYIGIDASIWWGKHRNELDNLLEGKEKLITSPNYHKSHHDLLRADGRSLPFIDNSVSEVVICNVFGSVISKTDLLKIIEEAKRVLGEQCLLTVVETYTPPLFTDIQTMFNRNGFRLKGNKTSAYKARERNLKLYVKTDGIKFDENSSGWDKPFVAEFVNDKTIHPDRSSETPFILPLGREYRSIREATEEEFEPKEAE